jgi:aldehyde dehydrogenase (NAD+)
MDSFNPDDVAIRGGHFIGGEYVEGNEHGARRIEVARPSDGVVYASVPVADADMVDRAVENAWRAFRASGWARMAPRERAKIMRRFAELVEADAPALGRLEALGSTRPVEQAVSWDVPFTAEGIRFYAEFADKLGGDVAATDHDHLGMTIAEPYGVIGAIAPWNFPLVMASWKIAPALAAGNAVVLKPSEMTPFSVLRLAELAVQAGVPAGIFNVIQGDGRTTGDELVRHPKISKVTFTGSAHGRRDHGGVRDERHEAGHARTGRQKPANRFRRCAASGRCGAPHRGRDHRQRRAGVRGGLAAPGRTQSRGAAGRTHRQDFRGA